MISATMTNPAAPFTADGEPPGHMGACSEWLVASRRLRSADRVGHRRRAAGSERLLGAHRSVPRGLMLYLGIELSPEQDHSR
jgi:hypothetical protein